MHDLVKLIVSVAFIGTVFWARYENERMSIRSASFEVFGVVQGVFFRKYTQQEAGRLGVVGWIRNTTRDTVEGEIQGRKDAFDQMKFWLQSKGSPHSKIDKAVFSNERTLEALEFKEFEIRRTK